MWSQFLNSSVYETSLIYDCEFVLFPIWIINKISYPTFSGFSSFSSESALQKQFAICDQEIFFRMKITNTTDAKH